MLSKLTRLRFHYVETMIENERRWLYAHLATPRLRYLLRSHKTVAEASKEWDKIQELIRQRLCDLDKREKRVARMKAEATAKMNNFGLQTV